jgi:hypothetical protein
MKFAKDKTTATAIALLLLLTIAVTLVALPSINAQTIKHYHSYIYVSASHTVIGVNQEVLIVTWTADIPPDVGEAEGLVSGGRQAWYDIKIEVTTPSGTVDSFTIDQSDPVGGGYVIYTPSEVGEYSVKAFFPETTKTYQNGDENIYSAAESNPITFIAQEESIQAWMETPLPTGYWMRPLNSANRKWYVLEGNWLGGSANVYPLGAVGGVTNNFVYGSGAESAHILWTRSMYTGGLMDERFEDIGFQTAHYQGLGFTGVIIVDGKIHYEPIYNAHYPARWTQGGWEILSLYTGEQLFLDYDAPMPAFGQIYNYESPNQHGGFAYLWRTDAVTLPEIVYLGRSSTPTNTTETPINTGTLWEMLDAFTGNSICYVANVSAPTAGFFGFMSGGLQVYGKDGSLLYYNIANLGTRQNPDYYLQVWNSSAMPSMLAGDTSTNAWMWRPSGGSHTGQVQHNHVHDGSTGFSLNISIPNDIGNSIRCVREGEYIIIGDTGSNNEEGVVKGKLVTLSLEDGNEGEQLRSVVITPPFASQAANVTVSLTGVYPEDGVILFEASKLLKRWGYSLETGELLWESEAELQFNYYGMAENVYEGILYGYGLSGQIRAYNITTGDILWTYNATNVGFESPYGNYPIGAFAICDGKLYTVSSEHSPTQPLWRGPNLRCINATDGTEVWSILFWGANMGYDQSHVYMADGIVVGLNYYDNQIYAFGKGDSATTVTASPDVSMYGDAVLIKGTVTDQTPTGKRNINQETQFTLKGTPAISDEDMSAWMEYLFMGQAFPADAKGVEVILETLDPNGNFYEIGRTTSDINGNYGFTWEPPVPGDYQIFATFEGSASYGSSSASTYMSVAEAPEASPTPTPSPAPMTDTYVLGIGAGAIIAIIVVGLVIILMLRKR